MPGGASRGRTSLRQRLPGPRSWPSSASGAVRVGDGFGSSPSLILGLWNVLRCCSEWEKPILGPGPRCEISAVLPETPKVSYHGSFLLRLSTPRNNQTKNNVELPVTGKDPCIPNRSFVSPRTREIPSTPLPARPARSAVSHSEQYRKHFKDCDRRGTAPTHRQLYMRGSAGRPKSAPWQRPGRRDVRPVEAPPAWRLHHSTS
jgi:hypothetical protein